MVDNQVFLPDRRKTISAVVANALREARIVGDKFEVGPVEHAGELRQLVERQHSVYQEHLVVAARQRALYKAAEFHWHRGFELEPNDRPASPPLKRGLV